MAVAPAATRVALASPWRAIRARASTGRASLMKVFHTPVISTASVLRARENPHESSIARASPTPIPDPPGTVLVTAVPDWATVMAWVQRSPGSRPSTGPSR